MIFLQKLELDFSNNELHEILGQYSQENIPAWASDVLDFITKYHTGEDMVCSTSGTTGSPKQHLFSVDQLNYSANKTNEYFTLKRGDKVLLPLSVNFIAGKLMIVRSIIGKLKLTVVEPSSDPLLVMHENERFQFCPVVPMQVKKLLETGKIKQLDKILIGGAALGHDTEKQLISKTVNAWASFGMTETLTHFALQKVSPKRDPFYTCLTDFTLTLTADSCLEIHNDKFLNKKLVTNDVVQLKEGSKVSFKWKGRADNVINSGGVKLFPEEIERKLRLDSTFNFDFVIVSKADATFGQVVAFCYEDETINLDKVKVAIKKLLSPFEVPRHYELVSRFQKTNSGKIKRNLIKLS